MTKDTEDMTADEALLALHDRLSGGVDYATMTAEERRAYNAEAKRRQREREREARAKGRTAATETNVRSALADAALMLLATNAKGAEVVRQSLLAAFPGMPGIAMTVEQRVKAGKLKPKLVDPARLAEVREEIRKATAVLAEEEQAAAAPAKTTARIPPPAPLPVEEDDDFEVPRFLRKAAGEV